ncbi:MAG: adenylyltransferase/cytidyltransferase family protein [Chlamydiia bacterium]|nr:adenylyltransferase/cytidyltransferase family protein [Chlamydiia bacterium]
MPESLDLRQQSKIRTFDALQSALEEDRRHQRIIVQCHGVFDLLHPGHIRHFQEAKAQGDRLIVTLTPDRFVNKGPGRPVFNEQLRLESIAALQMVDYVVLNDSPDAVSAIRRVCPSLYVKGVEYKQHDQDVTGKISEEARAVEEVGGAIYYTDDIVFSSSSLLNRYFDTAPPKVTEFLSQLRKEYTTQDIIQKIDALSQLNVLVVGDAIIDEYQYTRILGQTGKGLHMVARCLDREVFLGGSLIIANHVAQFAKQVTLVTALGKNCPHLHFIRENLEPNVRGEFTFLDKSPTLTKKRYVWKDGTTLTKLFETYSNQEEALNEAQTGQIIDFIRKEAAHYDLILVSDFGNGFTNHPLVEALCDVPGFLALNTQTNSGNRGFNVVTNYCRADYISLNEPELRLAAHDSKSALEGIAADICQILNCPLLSVTQGVHGVSCFSREEGVVHIPAFATHSVDRIGAGDSYLSLSSLCLAHGYSTMLAGFIGSIAAAMSVQVVGNQESVKKVPLCKFITRLLK